MITRSIALLLMLPGLALAQDSDLRLPISLDADSTNYDGKSSMLMFRGLKLSQGTIGIEADVGRASKLDFQDSVWRFEGNVIIDVDNGHIECDSADLQFSDHQLRLAIITGSPATFEMKRPGSEEPTYAEANELQYDISAGVIEFSGAASITEGGNQITSNFLVYNIKEQRINALSSGDGDSKVKITYTPQEEPATDNSEDVAQPDDESDAASDEANMKNENP